MVVQTWISDREGAVAWPALAAAPRARLSTWVLRRREASGLCALSRRVWAAASESAGTSVQSLAASSAPGFLGQPQKCILSGTTVCGHFRHRVLLPAEIPPSRLPLWVGLLLFHLCPPSCLRPRGVLLLGQLLVTSLPPGSPCEHWLYSLCPVGRCLSLHGLQ